MISGRASEVQRNSVHVASSYESNDASIVEAYQPIALLSGAACGRWDPFFDPSVTMDAFHPVRTFLCESFSSMFERFEFAVGSGL